MQRLFSPANAMTIRRILSRFWRALGWLLLTVAVLAATLVAALWWANRHDDPLRPEVAAALRFEPPTPEAMRGNGYFVMLGLGAPAGEDAFDAGQRFFAAQMRGYELLQRTGEIKSFIADAWPHQLVDMAPMHCTAAVKDCYAHYLAHADAIRSALSGQAPLVERYLSLLDTPVYEEILPPYIGLDSPYYADAVAASELTGAHAALLLNEHRLDEGLELLGRNAQLHERLMAGSRTTLGAMIALAIDMRQQRLIGDALRHLPAMAKTHENALYLALQPLPTSIAPALDGELRYAIGSGQRLPEPKCGSSVPEVFQLGDFVFRCADLLLRPLAYLPHATLNQIYRNKGAGVELAQLSADQFDQTAAAVVERTIQAADNDPNRTWLALRNAWGRYFMRGTGPTEHISYIERFHDIEGHRRLLRLQIAALHDGVPPEQMPGWLAAQPPELRNPYTLQPMGWDAATQSLVFEGRQPQTQNPEPRNVYRVRLAP
jgi:hypothetical protein